MPNPKEVKNPLELFEYVNPEEFEVKNNVEVSFNMDFDWAQNSLELDGISQEIATVDFKAPEVGLPNVPQGKFELVNPISIVEAARSEPKLETTQLNVAQNDLNLPEVKMENVNELNLPEVETENVMVNNILELKIPEVNVRGAEIQDVEMRDIKIPQNYDVKMADIGEIKFADVNAVGFDRLQPDMALIQNVKTELPEINNLPNISPLEQKTLAIPSMQNVETRFQIPEAIEVEIEDVKTPTMPQGVGQLEINETPTIEDIRINELQPITLDTTNITPAEPETPSIQTPKTEPLKTPNIQGAKLPEFQYPEVELIKTAEVETPNLKEVGTFEISIPEIKDVQAVKNLEFQNIAPPPELNKIDIQPIEPIGVEKSEIRLQPQYKATELRNISGLQDVQTVKLAPGTRFIVQVGEYSGIIYVN